MKSFSAFWPRVNWSESKIVDEAVSGEAREGKNSGNKKTRTADMNKRQQL